VARHALVDFLAAVDAELAGHADDGETLPLFLLGRSALVLGFGVDVMTKDVDVVFQHGSRLLERAVEVFGAGRPGARRLGFFLETVSSGLPPLPAGFQGRCVDIPGDWSVIRPKRPEAHDLAVTKLGRFHAKDRADVQTLCDSGLLTEAGLARAFDLAHAFSGKEGEDEKRDAAHANLQAVVDYLQGRRRTL